MTEKWPRTKKSYISQGNKRIHAALFIATTHRAKNKRNQKSTFVSKWWSLV